MIPLPKSFDVWLRLANKIALIVGRKFKERHNTNPQLSKPNPCPSYLSLHIDRIKVIKSHPTKRGLIMPTRMARKLLVQLGKVGHK